MSGNPNHCDPESSADVPTERFGWRLSHDLLREGEFWWPQLPDDLAHTQRLLVLLAEAEDADDHELAEELYAKFRDLDRRPSLTIPGKPGGDNDEDQDDDEDEDEIYIRALEVGDIANWAFGSPADMTAPDLVAVLSKEEWACLRELARELRRPDLPSDKRLLSSFLHEGLEARRGSYLTSSQIVVYMHLHARGIPLGSLRVCESCLLVHQAPRANLCRRCTTSPPRPTTRPWHTKLALPDRRPRTTLVSSRPSPNGSLFTLALQSPRLSHMTYTGTCQGCSQEFSDQRGDVAYCDECQLPPSRTRRSRAKRDTQVQRC